MVSAMAHSPALLFAGAAAGGCVSVALATRIGRRKVLVGSLLLAPGPALIPLAMPPGSPGYLAALIATGALL
jgi:hypothetical protein